MKNGRNSKGICMSEIFSPSCNPKQGLFSGENHGIRAFRECQRSPAGLAARSASM
jgi:hypothetical protein